MADFCRDCSIEHFGKDFKELANLSTPEDTAAERYARTICEGCGFVWVNHEGVVVHRDSELQPEITIEPKTDLVHLPAHGRVGSSIRMEPGPHSFNPPMSMTTPVRTGVNQHHDFMFFSSNQISHNPVAGSVGSARGCSGNTRQSGRGWTKVMRGFLWAITTVWTLVYLSIFVMWVDDQIKFHRAMQVID